MGSESSNKPDLGEVRRNRAGVRRICAELESALAEPSRTDPRHWSEVVSEVVDALASAFRRHVEITESANGLLVEMVAVSPRLSSHADRLRRDHSQILSEIQHLRGRASHLSDAVGVDEVRSRGLDLLRHISEHRHLGAELVNEAYLVDIEAAD